MGDVRKLVAVDAELPPVERNGRRISGRAADSFSGLELAWLDAALKSVLTGQTRRLEYMDGDVGGNVLRKILRMRVVADRDAERRAAHADEVFAARLAKLGYESERATLAVVANDQEADK